jgi:hypothetical protein
LISTLAPSAAAAAAVAASAAFGSLRCEAASPQPPTAAMSGHLTHQADASTNTAVSGHQCTPWNNSRAAPSS